MKGHYTDVWQAVAAAIPDRPAIRTAAGEEWSYRRFAAEAGSLAAWLDDRGLRAGDRVALLLHNRPEFLVAFFACLSTGMTPVPLNYRLRASEVAALLDDSDARALVFPTSLARLAADAVDLADHDMVLVHATDDDTPEAPGTPWSEIVDEDGALPAGAPDAGELWIYTGGTTGRPKAARWLAPDMFEAQEVPAYVMSGRPIPASMAEAVEIAADRTHPPVRTLPLAPLMHGTALTSAMNSLLVGGTILLTGDARLDAHGAVEFAVREGATRIIVAGDAIAIPIADAAEELGIRLDSVTSVISSGMRFSPDTKRRLHELADLTIYDLLASTEGGAFAVTETRSADDVPGRPRLLPTAVVFDADFVEVQDISGSRGVLAQRGALPVGYHGDAAKTAETFPVIDGRRHVIPGDWVIVQDDRHIEFLGRGSGVINTGGEKVYPLEVEEALLSHPGVADAVVLGIPHPRFGEVVTAVVERARTDVDAAELQAHVGDLLAGYKKPRHIVFRDSLERTPTGKIDLVRLRTEVSRHADDAGPTAVLR